MEYFAIINGVQAGPLSIEGLVAAGVQPDTMVWRQGLQDWVPASTLPELESVLGADSAFGGYARPEEQLNPYATQQPYGQQPGYGRPDPYNPYANRPDTVAHTNWLPWAIVATVVGFFFSCIGMVFGIIGISNASKANNYYAQGFIENGEMSNKTARTMTIIALVLAGIGIILLATGVLSNLTGELTEQLLEMAE